MDLRGKCILITGGANGIGRALAEAFSNIEKTTIIIFDKESATKVSFSNPNIFYENCDISNPSKVKDAIVQIDKKFGQIDILINNAALVHNEPLISWTGQGVVQHDITTWDDVIQTNINAVFYVTSQTVSSMISHRNHGVVINISSICASGNAGQSAYSASKAAVNAMTVSWAKELGPLNIRFVSVAPGFIETNTTLDSLTKDQLKSLARQTPVRKLGSIDEVVKTIKFVINNDFVNGTVIEVNGGLRI